MQSDGEARHRHDDGLEATPLSSPRWRVGYRDIVFLDRLRRRPGDDIHIAVAAD